MKISHLKFFFTATFVFWLAQNIIAPFIAIFAIQELPDATTIDYGLSALVYFLAFGLSVIVLGQLADKIRGYKDDLAFALIGHFVRGIAFVSFAFVTSIFGLFIIQFFVGVSRGFSDSVKDKIQVKLTDGASVGTSFSLNIGIINLAAALGAGLGGWLTAEIGFRPTFVIVGVLTIISGIIYSFSAKYLFEMKKATK